MTSPHYIHLIIFNFLLQLLNVNAFLYLTFFQQISQKSACICKNVSHNYTFYTCKLKSGIIFASSREFTWFSSVIFTEFDNRKMRSTRQVNVNASMIPATTAHVRRSVALFPPACEFKPKARVLARVTARIQRKNPALTQVVITAWRFALNPKFFSTPTTTRQTIKKKII